MIDARHPASRRTFLFGSTAVIGSTLLSGCDRLAVKPWFRTVLDKDEDANLYVQRLLLSDQKLAPQYASSQISPWFKPNGTADPSDKDYKALAKAGFQSFRLTLDGLVERPLSFSLDELRALPSRTQITRHDCVEGWSCIGQWTGVPLATLLQRAGLRANARFVVFYCADTMDDGGGLDAPDQTSTADDGSDEDSANASKQPAPRSADPKAAESKVNGNAKANMKPDDPSAQQPDTGGKAQGAIATTVTKPGTLDPKGRYYESIDLEDAFHPQTILAYDMNGVSLPVAHGAPLRLRVERQLGYKMAKYVMRIAVVDQLASIGQGGGGYWEDNGYEWYAGI